MEPLKLSLPQQHDYTDPSVETDAARLRAWLDDLPIMDVVETLRLLSVGVEGLNAQRLDTGIRMELLEAYRSTTLRLLYTVDPLQLGRLNLTRVRRSEAIEGIDRLLRSLTSGYKLVVAGLYAASGRDRLHPQLGHALHRALQQMTFLLLDSFRFYREVEPWLVGESHRLYRLARRFGLLATSTLEDSTTTPVVTSAGYYHAGMLLALTEPARLEEGEAGLLFDVLLRHADQCRIVPGNHWTGSGEGLFLIDLQSDSLPLPCHRLDAPVSLLDACLLDANPALQAIRAELAGMPAGVRMQSPEARVLRRLLPEDTSADRRREQRHGDGRMASLLNGLDRIHACLRSAACKGAGMTTPPEAVQCRVLDRSAGGMRFSWEEGGAGDARVGDLLGVLEPQEGKPVLHVAIIRSVRVLPQGGMETGVQLLAGGVGAVYCMLPDRPGAGTLPALFMPASEDERVNATLLLAKGVYEFGRELHIDVGGRGINARAGRRVYDSPVFDRFEFAAQ